MVVEFKNEPGYDFSVQENVDMFKKALKDVEKELGQDIPLVINGEKIFKDDKIKSINPADTSQVIANASKATKQDVEDAFKAANEAYKSWKTWSANDRAELMLRVSAIIRRRKAEIAAIMVYEAGLPKGVVNFVPGDPKEIGDYLVDHKDTHFVTFTGSRATGTRIYERSAVVQEGQNFLKRVIAEMGGKDAIVVDENIDTDMAAEAIVTSAFGFSGQKCSACSRAIVHKDVYDEVLEKSIKLTKELTLGNTVDNTYMGPVINKKQFDKIKNYIEIGKEEGKLEQGGGTDDSKGYFVEPTIISGLKSKDRIMQEEIFGPVVGFVKVNDFDEAIEVANDTDYGLTGAVITNNREHWIKAVNEFDVGNLYLNRGCTSAVVGYHPFGGFKMSGTDAKTGSPDYLLHFLEQKVVSEMF
ncbi:TPA: aldehyde dehydrogenase family protein [Staphylococcus aureus]|nr:aldehyde dehydrogenase family protein [Staphylococcus aureus]